MTKWFTMLIAVCMGVLMLCGAGCQQAEEPGEEAAEAMEETGDAIMGAAEEAGDEMEEAADEVDEEM